MKSYNLELCQRDLENVILSEVSQKEEDTHGMISFICGIERYIGGRYQMPKDSRNCALVFSLPQGEEIR